MSAWEGVGWLTCGQHISLQDQREEDTLEVDREVYQQELKVERSKKEELAGLVLVSLKSLTSQSEPTPLAF